MEAIITHHIDEHLKRAIPFLKQLGSVVLGPLRFIITEISRERLLSPLAIDWICYGSESGDGLVLSRVLEELEARRISKLTA